MGFHSYQIHIFPQTNPFTTLLPGVSGNITLQVGQTIEIERDRVELGQIEHLHAQGHEEDESKPFHILQVIKARRLQRISEGVQVVTITSTYSRNISVSVAEQTNRFSRLTNASGFVEIGPDETIEIESSRLNMNQIETLAGKNVLRYSEYTREMFVSEYIPRDQETKATKRPSGKKKLPYAAESNYIHRDRPRPKKKKKIDTTPPSDAKEEMVQVLRIMAVSSAVIFVGEQTNPYSDLLPNASGQIRIRAGDFIEVEASRVNIGQVDILEGNRIVRVIETMRKMKTP